ncbi:MAG: hypothetical protein ACM65M_04875 [Microcoleus sp.]
MNSGWVARNRVFSRILVTPPRNCQKPGFLGLEILQDILADNIDG